MTFITALGPVKALKVDGEALVSRALGGQRTFRAHSPNRVPDVERCEDADSGHRPGNGRVEGQC